MSLFLLVDFMTFPKTLGVCGSDKVIDCKIELCVPLEVNFGVQVVRWLLHVEVEPHFFEQSVIGDKHSEVGDAVVHFIAFTTLESTVKLHHVRLMIRPSGGSLE